MQYVEGLVSCLVPCYNVEKYLDELFDSIINQTYKYVELIFIDDGSEDKTYNKLSLFKKKYANSFYDIYVKRHIKNKGLCASINDALKYVHGEYITWFDSDDILDKNCIEAKVTFLRNNREYYGVMGVGAVFIDNEKNVITAYLGREKKVGNDFSNYLLQYCATSAGLNMLYTEKLFDVLPQKRIREDIKEQNWYMIPLFAAKYKIGNIDNIVFYYRIHSDSDSHKHQLNTGRDYKKYWDDVDKLRYYVINDSKLSLEDKYMYFSLQRVNSITNRVTTIDEYQYIHDRDYVDKIVSAFLTNGKILESAQNRNIYIWGTSDLQARMFWVLNKYIKIAGFVDSNFEDKNRNIICGKDISREEMFLIIPIGRYEQVLSYLNCNNFMDGRDYYYPKNEIYNSLCVY